MTYQKRLKTGSLSFSRAKNMCFNEKTYKEVIL